MITVCNFVGIRHKTVFVKVSTTTTATHKKMKKKIRKYLYARADSIIKRYKHFYVSKYPCAAHIQYQFKDIERQIGNAFIDQFMTKEEKLKGSSLTTFFTILDL